MRHTGSQGIRTKHRLWRRGFCALLAGTLAAAQATASGTLVYSATNFTERWQNDGGFAATITVTLTNQNDNFSGTNGQDFVTAGKVTPANVPSGLTAVATRTATNQVVLSFTGLAPANTNASNIGNLSFAFGDTAFSNGPASTVTWAGGTNLSVIFLAQNPSDWYVATTGSDTTGNGSSGNPYATVAKAVSMAQSAANDVIHVAAGTYTENTGTGGGYLNGITKILTITGNSSADTILQAAATAFTTNKAIAGFSNSGMVKNLTLRHGNNTGSGGAMALPAADFYFDSCLFASNAAAGSGGAVNNGANLGSMTFYFQNCQFVGNRANGASSDGGAICTFQPSVWVSNCTFQANTAGHNGGAISHGQSGSQFISIFDSTFVGNSATNDGGTAIGDNGTIWTIGGCTIANNSAGHYGGGLVCSGNGTPRTIYNSTIYGNTAGYGGGIYFWAQGGVLNIYNTTIVGNTATNKGGGLWDDYYGGNPGGFRLYSSIVASNTAPTGPDIVNGYNGSGVMTLSILGNNSGAGSSLTAGDPIGGNYIGSSGSPIDAGVQPLANNGGLRTTCAILPTSRAVNHGTNILNLATDGRGAGCPRVAGAACDIGAYELKTLSYSSTTFYESIPLNDGSITNALTVTVSGDTFNATPGENLVASGKVATNHVPAGLSVVLTNISSTQVVVTLTGNATANTAGDSIGNLTLNFLDAAFGSASAASVPGASRGDLGVTFFGATLNRSLSYNLTNFLESVANDGSIASTLVVTLSGDTFNASPGVTVGNYPAGLTPVVAKLTDLTVSISFTGAATLHRAANDVGNLTVTFLDSAFFGGNAATVTNSTRSDLQVLFLDPAVNYSGDTFTEAAANDGSMGNTLALNLAGDTLNATNNENLVASGKVATNHVPAGLTAVLTCTGSQTLTASLTGKASPQNAASSVANLTFAFADGAFTHGVAAAVTNATRSNLKVNFLNPALTYSGTAFAESVLSPGVIANTLTITLLGDTLAGATNENLVGSGKVNVSNVPPGLTAVLTQNTSTQATLSLTGVAIPNDAGNSISNLTVQFLDTAFTGANAAIVTNATVTNLAVNFISPIDWYVATNGSDSTGNGTSNNPYATVAKAVNMAQAAANDTIHLRPGTYTENTADGRLNGITKFLTITGNSSADTILQAAVAPFSTNVSILSFAQMGYIRNLTLRHGNSAGGAGAVGLGGNFDFYFDNCLFASNGAATVGGAVANGLNSAYPTITFRNCQFVGNRAAGKGGAIYTYTPSIWVSNCTFLANSAGDSGGAINRDDGYSGGAGRLTVYDSWISGNAATNGGGAIVVANNTLLTIWNSTLSSNRAGTVGGAFASAANGGAQTFAWVYNSTICNNTAGNSGGAIYHWSNGGCPIKFYNSTVFANSAATNGGGVWFDIYSGDPYYYLSSSIVASNTAVTGPDIYLSGNVGTITNSLLGNKSNAGTGLVEGYPNAGGSYIGSSTNAITPLLAPLANNGGLRPTCALQPGSPAIDRGLNPLGLTWDERGPGYKRAYSARPLPQTPDMGAYEYGSQPTVPGTAILFR